MPSSWVIGQPVGPGSATSIGETSKAGLPSQYGSGIVLPFRRLSNGDFDGDAGPRLISSNVKHILMTPEGKYPWNPGFGSKLYLLRHANNDETLGSLANVYISDALKRWEPRVLVRKVKVGRLSLGSKNVLNISLTYSLGATTNTLGLRV